MSKTESRDFWVSDGRRNPNRKANPRAIKDDNSEYLKIIPLIEKGEAVKCFFDDNIVIMKNGSVFSRYSNRLLRPRPNTAGYMGLSIKTNGKFKTITVHRLVVLSFLGEIECGMIINHIDGNKANNSLLNLEVATYSRNATHALYELGRKSRMKFNSEQIEKIKSECVVGDSYSKVKKRPAKGNVKEIANKYGASKSYILQIMRGMHRVSPEERLFAKTNIKEKLFGEKD